MPPEAPDPGLYNYILLRDTATAGWKSAKIRLVIRNVSAVQSNAINADGWPLKIILLQTLSSGALTVGAAIYVIGRWRVRLYLGLGCLLTL